MSELANSGKGSKHTAVTSCLFMFFLPTSWICFTVASLWMSLNRSHFASASSSGGSHHYPPIMARSSSAVAPVLVVATFAYVLSFGFSSSFVAPPQAAQTALQQQQQAAVLSAALAAVAAPTPAFAVRVEEDDEGFDLRIVAVLALPLFAVSWALFNVWRVAFRQVVRIGESDKGNPIWDQVCCKSRLFVMPPVQWWWDTNGSQWPGVWHRWQFS